MEKKMKLNLPFLILLTCLIACQQTTPSSVKTDAPTVETASGTIPTASVTPVETPPVDTAHETPAPVLKPFLTVTACTNCTPAQWSFIQEANVKTNETVSSTCFAAEVLKFQWLKGWTLNRDNQQILASLVGADVKIKTEMYYTIKRVLGYTLADQPLGQYMEWLNSRYMLQWNRCDLASLLLHESSHKIGYDHTFNYTTGRENSVPYGLNTISDRCCVK